MITAEFGKNSLETLRFQLTEYRGKRYADMRIYYEDNGERKPTKKGLTLSPDIWPQFAEGIERLGQELEAQGLLVAAEEDL